MRRFLQAICPALLLGFVLIGCTQGRPNETTPVAQSPASVEGSSNKVVGPVCPVPPLNYEKIPGYQPASVDPSLSENPIAFISPTLEGNPSFYLGLLQQPVQFCGVAESTIVKVKLFASGSYVYEQKQPDPAEPELPLEEVPVNDGIWFSSFNFNEGGARDIVAKGYDQSGEEIASTSKISITLAEPNPR